MPQRVRPAKPVIGWREWIGLPDLGVEHVKVKIDTGARSSALHAFDVETFRRGGADMVRFLVHPYQRESKTTVEAEARVLDERWVRSSSGKRDRRPVIETHVLWGGERWPIELTLTRRDTMGFRMLLGREAVRGRFVVDAGRSYYGGRPSKAVRRRAGKRRRPAS
jgi:hypothetical protein